MGGGRGGGVWERLGTYRKCDSPVLVNALHSFECLRYFSEIVKPACMKKCNAIVYIYQSYEYVLCILLGVSCYTYEV